MSTNTIRCPCGSHEAYWHGDTLREFCCDACWEKKAPSTSPFTLEERRSNAALIAAAPEMLEALQKAEALLADCLDGRPRTVAVQTALRAAIAKATGGGK